MINEKVSSKLFLRGVEPSATWEKYQGALR